MKTDDGDLRRRVEALEAVVGGTSAPTPFRDRLYARASRAAQASGIERYVRTESIPITWIGVVLGDGATTPDRCLVVTRGADGTPELEAVVRCLQVP